MNCRAVFDRPLAPYGIWREDRGLQRYYHSTAGDRRSPLQTYGEVLDPGEDCRGGLRPPAGALPYLERGSAGAYNGINYRSSAGDHGSPLQTYGEVLDPGEDCRGGL